MGRIVYPRNTLLQLLTLGELDIDKLEDGLRDYFFSMILMISAKLFIRIAFMGMLTKK